MSIEAMKQALEKIANVNATDYEYQQWAREALAIAEAEKQEPDELTIAYMSGLYDGKKKREWQGLTDEYLEELLMNYGYDGDDEAMKEMFRDSEAKLREKNGC